LKIEKKKTQKQGKREAGRKSQEKTAKWEDPGGVGAKNPKTDKLWKSNLMIWPPRKY